MGFFDNLSSLLEAATPWSTVEAESPTHSGASAEKTPADSGNGGEVESEDSSGSTPDKRGSGSDEEEVGNEEASGVGKDEEPEEEEEEEPVDLKEKLEEECKESKQCSAPKHHFDECVERVTSGHNMKYANEDCVEEFFHLTHCAGQCAAPKLWSVLK